MREEGDEAVPVKNFVDARRKARRIEIRLAAKNFKAQMAPHEADAVARCSAVTGERLSVMQARAGKR